MSNPGDEGASETNVQEQLRALSRKHEEAMASIATLSKESNRSFVYVPRERHISPFSGDFEKDGRSVDDFIEEVKRVLRARNQSDQDEFDFVMSLLRGAALEEVRLRCDVDNDQVSDLFTHLQEAFQDKRSVPQLLHSFYSHRQNEGEDLQEFSHALSKALSAVLRSDPQVVVNERVVLRDQFIEGVRDLSLKRELRKYVRDNPRSSMINVREEAYLWTMEESSVNVKTPKSKGNSGQAQCAALQASEQRSTTLEDVLKVVVEQGKAISELTQAMKDLAAQGVGARATATRPRLQPEFAEDGQPICFKCRKEGHIARDCPQKRSVRVLESSTSNTQGNSGERCRL